MEWWETDAGVRAAASDGASLHVSASGLTRSEVAAPLPVDADAVVAGRADELAFPDAPTALVTLDGDPVPCRGSATLDSGEYVLRVDAGVVAVLRFAAPASITSDDARGTVVSLDDATDFALGFCGHDDASPGSMTVPATPTGAATAVTCAAAGHRTTGPDRSLPAMRRRPPDVTIGDLDVPDEIRAAVPETGITFRLPASLSDVLVAAPLAYYLGAEVTVAEDVTPRLRAPGVGLDRTLRPLPEVAAAMLRRVFWLDCLVRSDGTPAGIDADLDALGLDPAAVRAADLADRLRQYFAAPFERVAADFPEWHLAMYVAPRAENVACLPSLLHRLAAIYPPETEDLAGRELIERSLDDFYRGDSPHVDVRKPVLRRGRLHGWLADGTPIDVFKSVPAAYRNRCTYRGGDDRPFEVTVVLNDAEMAGEQAAVADVYRERASALPMTVSLRRNLTRGELAEVFADRNHLVHYIGHCETGGLQCADGTLDAADVPESNAETFFLNACGSFHEGLELVRKGSVAGAVTLREVLDEQAATVGTTFARLLVNGFCIERAIRLARRQIVMGKDYAIVGDGTHAVTRPDGGVPMAGRVTERDDGRYRIVCEAAADQTAGQSCRLPVTDGACLSGDEVASVVGRANLVELLDGANMPVVFDGKFYWSDALADRL